MYNRDMETPGGQGAGFTSNIVDDPVQLARLHTARAIQRLAELMELDGRQSQVAFLAARALVEIATPRSTDDEKIQKLVEEKFKMLVDEARKKLEARQAGALAPEAV